MIRRILVGLGGLETEGAGYTESATQMAIDLAQSHDARLTGVTVVDLKHLERVGPTPIGAGASAASLREHRVNETQNRIEEAVAHFSEACHVAGVDYSVLREERSRPFDYLISQARYHDLALLGLRGMFEYGVMGEAVYDPVSALVKLIHGGVRPLVATGPETRRVERVLVAYSGSVESAKTMRRFCQLRLWPEAKVRIVAFGHEAQRSQQRLAHAANYFADHGVEVETDYEPADPREGVLRVAHGWGADMIVMGNSHRTLLARRVLGDTLLDTIQKSDVPLFLSQ